MKQTVLLLSACLIAGFSNGQESTINSYLFGGGGATQPHATANQQLSVDQMNRMHQNFVTMQANAHRAAEKTTSTTISDWYNIWEQNYNTSGSNVPIGYYWQVFPDSNVYDATNTSHIFTHMMGMSFDPTDSAYFDSTFNFGCLSAAVSQPMAPVGQSYTIDSFFADVTYLRYDATTTDSLIIELSVAIPTVTSGRDTGTYNLQFSTYESYFTGYAADGMPRFSTIHYNPGLASEPAPYNAAPYINDVYFDSVTGAPTVQTAYHQRIAIGLKTGSDADTTNGVLNLGHLYYNAAGGGYGAVGQLAIKLPYPATLTSKEHMVAAVSFKSGHAGGTYPLGTLTTAANWIKLYAGSPRSTGTGTSAAPIAFAQASHNTALNYPGSYQSGLNINNQSRYDATVSLFSSGVPVHDEMIGGAAYASTSSTYYDFIVTDESFHITWTATPSLGISNVVNKLSDVAAYPNPARNVLNVTYTATTGTSVVVTLTDMLGQVVASQNASNGKAVFNTSTIPAGVYVYTLLANGERTTGRVVIAH